MWNLNSMAYNFISLFKLTENRIGRFIATLLAIPLSYFFSWLYYFNVNLFWVLLAIFLIKIFIFLFIVQRNYSDFDFRIVMWDEILGLMIAFAALPFRPKLIAFGYIIFFAFEFLRRKVFNSFFSSTIEKLPLGLGEFSGDIVVGLISYFFLKLLLWVVG